MAGKLNRGIIIILFFLLVSCLKDSKKSQPKQEYQISNETEWVGRTVVFPNSLVPIGSQDSINAKSNSSFTIVSYYDGNCSVCYMQLMQWLKQMEIFDIYNVSYKFVLLGANKEVIKTNLEGIRFPINKVYFDEKSDFSKEYDWMLNNNYSNASMLLNKENVILLVGNPTTSKNLETRYFELLNK